MTRSMTYLSCGKVMTRPPPLLTPAPAPVVTSPFSISPSALSPDMSMTLFITLLLLTLTDSKLP